MRTMKVERIAAGVAVVLLGVGAVAAGCISNTASVSPGVDASFSFDGGSLDSAVATDATLDSTAPEAGPGADVLDVGIPYEPGSTLIDFGLVACGTGQASKTYTFTNTTPLSIQYSAVASSVFSVADGGASGTVAPGQTASITVIASGVPTTASPGATIQATLAVTTNVLGAHEVDIPLQLTTQGGSLVVSPSAAAFGTVALGDAGPDGSATLPLSITNVGNAPVTLTFSAATQADGGADPEFGLTYAGAPDAATIAQDGGALAHAVATFAPEGLGASAASIAIQTSDPLCGGATSIAMTATAVGTPQASFPTTTIPVSAVCGGGPTTQGSLTITNNGTAPLTLSAVASKNATFTIVSSPTAPIAPKGTGTIVIQAASIGQGTAGGSSLPDDLTFSTNEPSTPSYMVPVAVAVNGANLAFQGLTTNVLTTSGECSETSYTVSNTGNMDAVVVADATTGYPSISDTNGDANVFQFEGTFSSPTTVAANGKTGDEVIFGVGTCEKEISCVNVTGTQTFSTSGTSSADAGAPDAGGDAGASTVGVCIPLPTLTVTTNPGGTCGCCEG